jgi:hypothetical protein
MTHFIKVDYGNGLTKNFSPETVALLGSPAPDALRELTREWAEGSGNYRIEMVNHGETQKTMQTMMPRNCKRGLHKWHTGNRFRSCLHCPELEKRTDSSGWEHVARRLQD